MAKKAPPEFWADADRISDAIVVVINHEIKAGTSPVQILTGQLLAFKALMWTTPALRPVSLDRLEAAIDTLLDEVMTEYGRA